MNFTQRIRNGLNRLTNADESELLNSSEDSTDRTVGRGDSLLAESFDTYREKRLDDSQSPVGLLDQAVGGASEEDLNLQLEISEFSVKDDSVSQDKSRSSLISALDSKAKESREKYLSVLKTPAGDKLGAQRLVLQPSKLLSPTPSEAERKASLSSSQREREGVPVVETPLQARLARKSARARTGSGRAGLRSLPVEQKRAASAELNLSNVEVKPETFTFRKRADSLAEPSVRLGRKGLRPKKARAYDKEGEVGNRGEKVGPPTEAADSDPKAGERGKKTSEGRKSSEGEGQRREENRGIRVVRDRKPRNPGDPHGSSSSSSSEDSDDNLNIGELWDEMTNTSALALKAKYDRIKGQITLAAGKIIDIVGDDDTRVSDVDGAKLIHWKERLHQKWAQVEAVLEEYAEVETDGTKRAQVALDGAGYEETYMQAVALVVAYEKKKDFNDKKGLAAAGTVLKDRTLFTFGQRKIKKFDGSNPDLWPIFEEEFRALLDSYSDSTVTDVEKFTLLREHVVGKAADRIAEVPLTSVDFEDAFKLLAESYGDKNQRVIRLCNRIQYCRPVNGISEGFNYTELDRVTTLFDGVIRTMKNMNFDIAANAGWIFANIRRVFPKQLLAMWDLATESKRNQAALIGSDATVEEFITYARARTRTLYGTKDQKRDKDDKSKKDKSVSSVNATVKKVHSTVKPRNDKAVDSRACSLCEGTGHKARQCPWWDSKPTDVLRSTCRKKSLCYGCGRPNTGECKCKPCKCGKGVHRARLCYENDPSAKKGSFKKKKPFVKKVNHVDQDKKGQVVFNTLADRDPMEGLACYSANEQRELVTENVVLETLLCTVRMTDEDGKEVEKPVRVFLDTGSNMNIIRTSVAEGVSGRKSYFSPYITGGGKVPPTRQKDVVIQLVSQDGSYVSPRFLATTQEQPTAPFPPVTFNPDDYPHLRGLKFTEKYPRDEFVDIDILVGLQVCNTIDKHEFKRGGLREPVAKKTELGWVLSGLCAEQSFFTSAHAMVHQTIDEKGPVEPKDKSISSIKASLDRLWKLETIGISDPVDSELTIDQERAKQMFYDRIKFENGSYHVPLLWKSDEPELDSNYRRAVRRDEALCNKFKKPEFREKGELFIEAVEEFFKNGYAERMTKEQLEAAPDGPVRYLSLQAVFREDKPKPRPVFDASEKTMDGKSLNSEILQGPPNIADLVEILLRFRTRPVVVTTDIKSMFLRIRLLDGTDSHRFVWRQLDKTREPEVCRLLTVTFGVIDSPYKSIEVVLHHADVHKKEYPKAHLAISEDSYVDDILSGAENVEEAWELYQQLKEMMLKGGFHLAKVMSNSSEFMSKVPEEDRAPLIQKAINGGEDKVGTHSALGASWDPVSDSLVFTFLDKFEEPKKGIFTRRVILSQGSRVFDPSGLIAPAMLQVKLILRECAEVAQGSWDAVMPENLVKKFLVWRKEIMEQSQVTIPDV